MESQSSVSSLAPPSALGVRLPLRPPMPRLRLAVATTVLAAIGALAGCGQKGPLTLPKGAASAPGAASAVAR